MDDEGMDTDALEEVLRSTERVKLVYTVPDYQNPTGRTMSLARRRRLVELAEEYDVVVLEDTPYRELRYEGERLPTIKSLDPNGRVVHLGSFSKILAPGLRLGWALATPEVREKLSLLKLAADTQNGTLNMRAAAAYLSRFDIEQHIADMLPTYRHQRDLMLATMAGALPGRHHLDPGPRWPVHLGDLPTGARPRGLPARRPHPARRGHRRAGDALLRRPPRGQPRPDELLRGARRAPRRRGAGHGWAAGARRWPDLTRAA